MWSRRASPGHACLLQYVLTRALIICIDPTHDWPTNISSWMADGKWGPTPPWMAVDSWGFLQWCSQLLVLTAVFSLFYFFRVLSFDYRWSQRVSILAAPTCVLCKLPLNILFTYLLAIIFSLLLTELRQRFQYFSCITNIMLYIDDWL